MNSTRALFRPRHLVKSEARHSRRTVHLELGWATTHPAIGFAFAGSLDPEEIEENGGAFEFTFE